MEGGGQSNILLIVVVIIVVAVVVALKIEILVVVREIAVERSTCQ